MVSPQLRDVGELHLAEVKDLPYVIHTVLMQFHFASKPSHRTLFINQIYSYSYMPCIIEIYI